MKRLALFVLPLILLFSSCEKGEITGVADNEVLKEDILGGWKVTNINCQLVYNQADPLASLMPFLKTKMQENLEKRISDGSLFFMNDTVYYIETPEPGVSFVRAYGHYELTNHPAIMFVENTHLVCDAYATYFYIKFVDNRLCLYLTRPGALAMIREDGSMDDYIGLIDKKIEDAQFEFYMERNHLALYDDIIRLYGDSLQ
ncbi:MAG: hypothetical protein MJZ34_00365 [Paludibacteraceae bacterium]|nr:hypothetical protein [Paludibacteraceae bacterium]